MIPEARLAVHRAGDRGPGYNLAVKKMLTQCLQAAGTKHEASGHAEERKLELCGFKMENPSCT
jgi:hypothetical protein